MSDFELPVASFPRRSRMGVIGRFTWGQLITFGVAGFIILIAVFGGSPLPSIIKTAPMWGLCVVLGVLEIQEIPILSWIGWGGVFMFRGLMGQTEFHREVGAVQSSGVMNLPGGMNRIELLEVHSHAFVFDPKRRTFTAIVNIESQSYRLSDSARKVRSVEDWGAILAQLHTHSGLVAAQIMLTTTATSPSAIMDYAASNGLGEAPRWVQDNYTTLTDEITTNSLEHRAYLAVSLSATKLNRQIKEMGGGKLGMYRLLDTEVRALTTALRDASIGDVSWVDARTVARIVREAYDPASAVGIAERTGEQAGVAPHSAGPMGVKILPDHLETDGVLASTWEVTEWPRTPVHPDFLTDIIALDVNHTLSMTFRPLSNRETIKRMNSALSDIDAERIRVQKKQGEKATKGFFRDQEEAAIMRRMDEFGQGHSDLEFIGTVTVYGKDKNSLLSAEQQLQSAAGRSRLELRRMYLRQDAAFNITALPFALGSKNG